jgi:hypothetical protein
MTISLYAASIPVFKQMINSTSAILSKAEQHAAAKNISRPHCCRIACFQICFR